MEPTFWLHLKERHIVQWTIGYLAASIALLEGINILQQTYDWSPVVPRVAIALVGIGFLVTLVTAWYHGERGSQHVPLSEVVLLTFIAFGGILGVWWAAVSAPARETGAATPAQSLLSSFDPGTATRSVAVLPFLNMSGDPANDFLADGVTEDIIAELGSIAGLRVISRTSVMRYRNTEKTVPIIGAELGVGTILEGSVRVLGDQIRIVAQLIDVASDGHVWTDTYDGHLKDVFGLQTRVARDVAGALNARLLPGVVASGEETQTVDPVAWRHYVLAKDLMTSPDQASRRLAHAHLDSAVLLDPEFARAYEALAEMQTPVSLDLVTTDLPAPSSEPAGDGHTATSTAERALELNPRLAGAQSALAVQNIYRRDMRGAEAAARKAMEANPNSATARLRYSQILALGGRLGDALTEASTASKLDPHSPVVESHLGELYFALGRPDQAHTHLTRAIANDSANVSPRVTLALVLEEQGRMEEALRAIEAAAAMAPASPLVLSTHGFLLGAAGRTEEARAVARQLEEQARAGKAMPQMVAHVYSGTGNVDETIDWLRQSRVDRFEVRGRGGQERDEWLLLTPRLRRTFDHMREDPRFRVVFDSMSLPPPWVWPDSGRRGASPDSLRRGRSPDAGDRGG
ncbi:MAG: tetratricopeptide repeat protein [Gemmatimonadetes bacterium]|nr:tetratricopeptide repeat protein [Gemmatimonadota bacterium]